VSWILLRRVIFDWHRRLLVVCAALALWGFLLPGVYATFGADFRALVESGLFGDLFDAFAAFGGGNVFSLAGSIALGLIHPIALALACVFAVGYPVAAVAGERQRGTLEVLLARPLERRALWRTHLVAMVGFVAACVTALEAGNVAGAAVFGVTAELPVGGLVLAWANEVALLAAIGSVALAASVSADRIGPALGVTMVVAIGGYAVEILGTLWPDLAWLRPASLFYYFQPMQVLAGRANPADFVALGAVIVAAGAWAWWVFPRRDLAAPS
jgi:ABC-type transport system involved in multi-copper enzyme maturation permease subunit